MSIIDELLANNERYAATFADHGLSRAPTRALAVVTCMDARLMVGRILGLGAGEAHVIRNAGAVVSDDVLRSLAVSTRLAGAQHVMVIGHADCAMRVESDEALWARLEGHPPLPATAQRLYTFSDVDAHVRRQLQTIADSPLIPDVHVRGFVYHEDTGRLHAVAAA